MRALVCDHGLRVESDYPVPPVRPTEALIRVRLAGICNTDLQLIRGYMGFRGVLGHEFVGSVEAAADSAWIGKRVVGDINAACYECETCRAGRHTHCPRRTTLGISGRDGAFADYLTLPIANLQLVPDALPDECAVFAEPLAAACEVLEQVNVRPEDRVVVLGDGKLGLLVAAVLRLTGADVVLVGRHPTKLAVATSWGIQTRQQVHGQADALASSLGRADIVVECTGSSAGFSAARKLVRARGMLVLKSTYHGDASIDMSGVVVDELTLVGSRCGPFGPALRLLNMGLIDPRPMISGVYSLAQGRRAFDRAIEPGVLKVLLRPEDSPSAERC